MNDEIRQRRRQAAWFCLQPHLPEHHLVEAIELLEQQFQFEGVSTLISYISTVCNQFNIPKDIGKSLCVKFFELTAHKNIELPKDPLILIDEKRQNALRQQELQESAEKAKQNALPPVEEIAAHSLIFMCFLKQIMNEKFADELTLIRLLKLCCSQDKTITVPIKTAIEGWERNPQSLRWVLPFQEQALAELTHLIYRCVCEVAGPVEADRVFHKAISMCEQRPEAKKFSPTRLL